MELLIKFHLTYQVVNVRENGMGQSRIDNPEILAELGTQDTGRRQKNTQTIKKMSNTDPTKNTGVKPCALIRGKQLLLLIRHPPCSWKNDLFMVTVAMLDDWRDHRIQF